MTSKQTYLKGAACAVALATSLAASAGVADTIIPTTTSTAPLAAFTGAFITTTSTTPPPDTNAACPSGKFQFRSVQNDVDNCKIEYTYCDGTTSTVIEHNPPSTGDTDPDFDTPFFRCQGWVSLLEECRLPCDDEDDEMKTMTLIPSL